MRSRSLLHRLDRLPRPERTSCVWDGSALDGHELRRAQELLYRETLASDEEAELRALIGRCFPVAGSPSPSDGPRRGDLVLSRDEMRL